MWGRGMEVWTVLLDYEVERDSCALFYVQDYHLGFVNVSKSKQTDFVFPSVCAFLASEPML